MHLIYHMHVTPALVGKVQPSLFASGLVRYIFGCCASILGCFAKQPWLCDICIAQSTKQCKYLHSLYKCEV